MTQVLETWNIEAIDFIVNNKSNVYQDYIIIFVSKFIQLEYDICIFIFIEENKNNKKAISC